MRGKPPSVGRYSIQPIDTLVEPHPHRWSSGIRTWPLPTDTKERETLPLLRDSMDSGGTPEIEVDQLQLIGGIPTPLKNDGVRQLGSLFPYGNIKHVPNHQPDNGCEML